MGARHARTHAHADSHTRAYVDADVYGSMCLYVCPGAGTDVLGMSTTAVRSADGSHYVINGAKMWITNGTLDGKSTGDLYLVYARTGACVCGSACLCWCVCQRARAMYTHTHTHT